ncbi:unnamed protein product, partial [marine sediment metagenome]
VMYNNTTDAHQESLDYVYKIRDDWNLNFYETYPIKYTMKSLVKRWGGAVFLRRYCTYYMKIQPTAHFIKDMGYKTREGIAITGMRREEKGRKNITVIQKTKRGRYYQASPIYNWKRTDVEELIKRNNLPVNPVYEYHKRCGCVHCFDLKWADDISPRIQKSSRQ